MRILFVNEVLGHTSTGKICAEQALKMQAEGNEVMVAYGRDNLVPDKYRNIAYRIGSDFSVKLHGVSTRLFDNHGFCSTSATKAFLKWVDTYNPDLLWLHNLHGYYINVELLFSWIKNRPNMKVKWTLHDCWSFTGHCTYFDFVGCENWKTQCCDCPQKKKYPASLLFDQSKRNFERKKAAFTGVKDLSIITPSKWLAELVNQSFLKEYPVEVVYNTIDTTVFQPTKSCFREKHNIVDKKMVLAVSNAWHNPTKGLQDIYKLRKLLSEDYAIVVVGLNNEMLKTVPEGILGIAKTKNANELAEIYSTADVFINPTYEDNYPTVNLEAEACGTRVITYASGGSPETIHLNESRVVNPGDIDSLVQLIVDEKEE